MSAHPTSTPVHEIQTEFNVPVPMRDGTVLRADVYRPIAEGQYPVLVERVAYERIGRCQKNAEYYASRGYVFVGQSVRGCLGSEGKFTFCQDDAWGANRDGYDTVEWAASQPWSTGKVALFGGSYSGGTQYMAAPTRPPHLAALYVREGFSDTYRDASFRDGAYSLHVGLHWNMQTAAASATIMDKTATPTGQPVANFANNQSAQIDPNPFFFVKMTELGQLYRRKPHQRPLLRPSSRWHAPCIEAGYQHPRNPTRSAAVLRQFRDSQLSTRGVHLSCPT